MISPSINVVRPIIIRIETGVRRTKENIKEINIRSDIWYWIGRN